MAFVSYGFLLVRVRVRLRTRRVVQPPVVQAFCTSHVHSLQPTGPMWRPVPKRKQKAASPKQRNMSLHRKLPKRARCKMRWGMNWQSSCLVNRFTVQIAPPLGGAGKKSTHPGHGLSKRPPPFAHAPFPRPTRPNHVPVTPRRRCLSE
jgi:hypothetical protein